MTEINSPYRAHPKAEEYRLMSESELQELGADIEENGQHEPIVYSEGPASPDLLIDGRNRLLACLRVRVSPSIEYRRFESEEEIVTFIASKNDLRRHLTPEEQEKRREQRQARALQLRQEGKSFRQIAQLTNSSEATVRRDISTASRDAVELPTRIKGADGKERPAQRSARLQRPSPKTERASEAPQRPQDRDPEPALCPSSPAPKPTREELEALLDQAPHEWIECENPDCREIVAVEQAKELSDGSIFCLSCVGKLAPLMKDPNHEEEEEDEGEEEEFSAQERRRSKEGRTAYHAKQEASRTAKHAQIAKECKAAQKEGQLGPFSVLYIDPPWRYDARISESKSIETKYPTLSVEELCKLDIPSICWKQAVLYLWVTAPMALEAGKLLEAWDFTYKTQYVWCKEGSQGLGHWLRNNHELLYVATKGSFPTPHPEDRDSSVIQSPRTRHSEKPRWFRQHIESLYPEHPKVELFAREFSPGWVTLGNEINGQDIRGVLVSGGSFHEERSHP